MGRRKQIAAFGSARSYCQMRNAANGEAVIYIYDEIGGWGIWASEFVAALSRITADVVRVRIHCVGGWVDEAIAMHNALRKHPAHVITEIESIAASAASFLSQAGDERVIAENARMMIHDVQGMVWGTEAQIRAYADHIPGVREAIIATYDYRTNISADEAREMMTRGTDVYLSAAEAVEKGFADRIEKLADMGEPPAGLAEDSDSTHRQITENKRAEIANTISELSNIYGLRNLRQPINSVGSGQQDQGNQGENMNKEQLIAQLKETAGIDVNGLQSQVTSLTTELKTTQNALATLGQQHEALSSAIGDSTPEQITNALKASGRYTGSLVDTIVTGRRLLNLCGDSDDEVTAAKAMLSGMTVEQLEAEAATMNKATASMDRSQLTGNKSNADNEDADDVDTKAKNIVALGTRRRHTRGGK